MQVMGVVNVTPDSFSDGGRYLDRAAALAHARALVAEGADWIDVGGESTRPGADPVDEDEELRRVVPVVAALAADGVPTSIDTRKAAVAAAAVDAGARMVNDVTARLGDVAAATGAAFVAMHMQGEPGTMQVDPHYDDVVTEVRDHLVARADAARAAGVSEVWIDPGIGFGKTLAHNLDLLAHLDVLVAHRLPGPRRHQPQDDARHPRRPGRPVRGGAAARRPPGGIAGHRGVGGAAGRGDGPGPRCGGHAHGAGGDRRRCGGWASVIQSASEESWSWHR